MMTKVWRGHRNLQDLYSMLFDNLFVIKREPEEDTLPDDYHEDEVFGGVVSFSGIPEHLQVLHNMIYYIAINGDKFTPDVVGLAGEADRYLNKLSLITHTIPRLLDNEITNFNHQFCYNSRMAMLELNGLDTVAFNIDKVMLSMIIREIRKKLPC